MTNFVGWTPEPLYNEDILGVIRMQTFERVSRDLSGILISQRGGNF